ncbi:hypothetical protein GUJ93_ZPchr0005g15225 [Zizania palustris]|uniref:Uncharacterized protein n=1 Tax=Zizania palustris TaxID=103762 RepID=A0A8J5SGL3_ZIZPA|nr:hypothetical protein GUJ93_ZPchr0005g15225 [Zizania palustris]
MESSECWVMSLWGYFGFGRSDEVLILGCRARVGENSTAVVSSLRSPTGVPPWDVASLLPFALALVAIPISLALLERLRLGRIPPGPRPWPVVGNLRQIKPVRCRCFQEWAERYGRSCRCGFGSSLNVVVSTTELAKEGAQGARPAARRPAAETAPRSGIQPQRAGPDLGGLTARTTSRSASSATSSSSRPSASRRCAPSARTEVTSMVESVHRASTEPDSLVFSALLFIKAPLISQVYQDYAIPFEEPPCYGGLQHITRLAFGKRFINANGDIDEQGREFKTIVNNGIKIGASLSVSEYIWYLRWLYPLNEDLYKTHNERRDRLTKKIIEEHAKALKESGAKQHFVDALFTLREQYDLNDDTVIGLLWDMITAGMDTTVISVEWTMAELVRNPRVQKKLQEGAGPCRWP